MKKGLLFLLMQALFCLSNGQPFQHTALTKADLLYNKSRIQKTIGISTGATGVASVLTGSVMWLSEYADGLSPGSIGYDQRKAKTGETLVYAGLGLTFVGNYFLRTSKKNRNRALALAVLPRLKMERAPRTTASGGKPHSYPALVLSVGL